MKVLVTAGNTPVPIDKVRVLTNVFTGRTGALIALEAHRREHDVTLITSHPDVVDQLVSGDQDLSKRWNVIVHRTFDDFAAQLQQQIQGRTLDAVVHSAAVSDYRVKGIYAPAPETSFDPSTGEWKHPTSSPTLVDRQAGKVKSTSTELWLRLVQAPKLIDRIRGDWGFAGQLVKFKLEVGVSDEELLEVAERSRQHSQADWMIANTREGAKEWAYLGPFPGGYERVSRAQLPARLLDVLESTAHG